jgi:hypothetical protein
MKRISICLGIAGLLAGILVSCSTEEQASSSESSSSLQTNLVDVAQTSGQLASGTSFRISGSSSDSSASANRPGGKHRPHPAQLDGINLLAPTDELLAIVDAESASDFRGMLISKNGGATITNYDTDGNIVALTVPASGGPGGCSFSGHQFPAYDSLLSAITKTVIDFGSGVTYKRDTISITRVGKISITRSGTSTNLTEVTTFENYSVNGIGIEGTKARVSTFDARTGSGSSTTAVTDGKITLKDGTVTTWTTGKTRTSQITLDASTGKPVSGTIVSEVNTQVVKSDGTVLYSHITTKPLTENIACDKRRHGPVSGTLQTVYSADIVIVDYGDGTCENKTVTITVNGVTTTKAIEE